MKKFSGLEWDSPPQERVEIISLDSLRLHHSSMALQLFGKTISNSRRIFQMNNLGKLLKTTLKEHKCKAFELARKSNISPAYLSRLISGRSNVSVTTLSSIIRALGTLGIPPNDVYRAAGLPVEEMPLNDAQRRILLRFQSLPDDRQKDALEYVEYLARRVRSKERAA